MNAKKDNTEEKILEAAKNVFIKKGMEGARMQEIADEAKINKALLHYYFRSKEKLFNAIFNQIIKIAFPRIEQVIYTDVDFRTKVGVVIDSYLDLLIAHPYLPGFIMKEFNRDPSVILKLIAKYGFNIQPVLEVISEAMDRGEIIKMKPEHLVVNIVSMCVFPFAARPAISFVAFRDNKEALDSFFEERREVVKQFVIRAIEER